MHLWKEPQNKELADTLLATGPVRGNATAPASVRGLKQDKTSGPAQRQVGRPAVPTLHSSLSSSGLQLDEALHAGEGRLPQCTRSEFVSSGTPHIHHV